MTRRTTHDSTSGFTLIPPFDPEAELSVIAELFDPLRGLLVGPVLADFYDVRHQRIVKAHQDGRRLNAGDAAYVANAVRYAWPLTKQAYATFCDSADRRKRLVEIEAERLELYGVSG